MMNNIEKILSLLRAEGINPLDVKEATRSLNETVMPKRNLKTYADWLNAQSMGGALLKWEKLK